MASSGEYSCGYCLTEKEEMLEAKKLPCGHVFCLQCLLHDYQNSSTLTCIACRQEYKDLDLTKLESCSSDKITLFCDICGKNSTAGMSCLTCNKNMCQEHFEMHESFTEKFGHSHFTRSSLATHVAATEKRLCDIHNDEVKGACNVCQRFLCFKCLAESKCPNSLNLQHTSIDISELSASYKRNLNEKSSKLYDRINEIEELTRNANCIMAKEQAKCEEMKRQVDEVFKELTTMMMKKVGVIKNAIDTHYSGCENQVSLYIKNLYSNKEEIEQLRKEVNKLDQQSAFDVFLRGNEMAEKLEKCLEAEMSNFALISLRICRFESKDEIVKEISTHNDQKPRPDSVSAELQQCRRKLETAIQENIVTLENWRQASAEIERAKDASIRRYRDAATKLKGVNTQLAESREKRKKSKGKLKPSKRNREADSQLRKEAAEQIEVLVREETALIGWPSALSFRFEKEILDMMASLNLDYPINDIQ